MVSTLAKDRTFRARYATVLAIERSEGKAEGVAEGMVKGVAEGKAEAGFRAIQAGKMIRDEAIRILALTETEIGLLDSMLADHSS
jgi:hypothetical protein